MNTYTAQPESSHPGTIRSVRTPASLIKKRLGAKQESRSATYRSYNDEWVAGYKARHLGDGSRRAQEPEFLPCVWNIPHG